MYFYYLELHTFLCNYSAIFSNSAKKLKRFFLRGRERGRESYAPLGCPIYFFNGKSWVEQCNLKLIKFGCLELFLLCF